MVPLPGTAPGAAGLEDPGSSIDKGKTVEYPGAAPGISCSQTRRIAVFPVLECIGDRPQDLTGQLRVCNPSGSIAPSTVVVEMAWTVGNAPTNGSFGDCCIACLPRPYLKNGAATRLRSGASSLATRRHAIRPWLHFENWEGEFHPLDSKNDQTLCISAARDCFWDAIVDFRPHLDRPLDWKTKNPDFLRRQGGENLDVCCLYMSATAARDFGFEIMRHHRISGLTQNW